MMYLLALAAGATFCLGLAPFEFWPATLICVATLFALLNLNPKRATWVAFCFGVGKYGLGASWVYVSINSFGNAAPPLAMLLVVLFVSLLSFLFVLPIGWLYRHMRHIHTESQSMWSWSNVLIFSALWLLFDWLSSWLFTGFPWLLPGYGLIDSPLASVAPVAGVMGLGWLAVLSASAIAAFIALARQRTYSVPLICLALLGWVVAGALSVAQWVHPVSTHSVALVQGNIDQNTKWLPDQALPNVRRHRDLSAPHWDADLLVWPEAAITLFPQQAEGLLEELAGQAQQSATNMVLGIPGLRSRDDGSYEFSNLAIALGDARGRYSKRHLVPFGEYVPFEGLLRGLIEFFDLPMSSSTAGPDDQPNLQLSFGEAAMAICYEVVYGESMRKQATSAAVLMTISNDTWFGRSIGPLQHMQIARMRALENGRWLVRDTNNGVTAIVDHRGVLRDQLPQFTEGVLRGQINVMAGRTPYNRVGDWPVLIVIFTILLVRLRNLLGPAYLVSSRRL